MEPGDSIEGVLVGSTTGPWTDKATGEEKTLTRLFFDRPDGTKFLLFEDGGLKNAMANAMVKEGQLIKIEKKEKIKLAQGRTCNDYDIYLAE